VCELWLVGMGPKRLPSSALVGGFGSLGTYTNYGLYWELHPVLQSVVCSRFPARVLKVVAYRYGNKGDLEVTIQRCRAWITWWWPCGMESKDRVPLISACIYLFELVYVYLLAHPIYLCLVMIV